MRLQAAGWRYAGTFAVVVTLASGVFLACVRNIHGPALLAGVALAALLGGVAREPLRSRSAEAARSGIGSPPRSDAAGSPISGMATVSDRPS